MKCFANFLFELFCFFINKIIRVIQDAIYFLNLKKIAFIIFIISSFHLYSQVPEVKLYLEDGTFKQYNLSDIQNINVTKNKSNVGLKLYLKNNQTKSQALSDIDSIKFESNQATYTNMLLYISGLSPQSYLLADIDSINFFIQTDFIPEITKINPSIVKIGDEIKISGKNFGDSQDTNYISFGNVKTSNYTSWNDSEIIVKVPDDASSCKVTATINGTKSNEVNFTVLTQITAIYPLSNKIGDIITIKGSGFGISQGNGILAINGTNITDYQSWKSSEIKIKIPKDAASGKIIAIINGIKSNEYNLTVVPQLLKIEPSSAFIGNTITISGSGFGISQGTNTIAFNDVNSIEYPDWNSNEIKVKVPEDAISGNVTANINDSKSNEIHFIVIPKISAIIPEYAMVSEIITIEGSGFGSSQGNGYISFNNTKATEYQSWSSTIIKVKVPFGAVTRKVTISVNKQISNEFDFGVSKDYESVTIGKQVWMSKNLDVELYSNGDTIPEVKDSTMWSKITYGAWCYYNNDYNNKDKDKFCKLYNLFAVTDERGLAPLGWHVSTDEEWNTLLSFLLGSEVAGGKLKDTLKFDMDWCEPNECATNETGFSARPGGWRAYDGSFISQGFYGLWWTSTSSNSIKSWSRCMVFDECYVIRYDQNNRNGYSVRCVKDK